MKWNIYPISFNLHQNKNKRTAYLEAVNVLNLGKLGTPCFFLVYTFIPNLTALKIITEVK